MFNLLVRLSMLFLVFCVMFLFTTAICDWICWHSSYYSDAAQMATVMED